MLSLSEQKNCLKRQLELVKENQELTKDLEFKDYRISKLEQELIDLKNILLQKDKESKFTKNENCLKQEFKDVEITRFAYAKGIVIELLENEYNDVLVTFEVNHEMEKFRIIN